MINRDIITEAETRIGSIMGKVYSIINCWNFLLENKEVKRFSMVDIKNSMNENLHTYRKSLIKIKDDIDEYFVNNLNMFEPDPDIVGRKNILNHKIKEVIDEIDRSLNISNEG